MLNVMRKYASSWLIKVLLAAIVIVFIFWGVGSFKSRKNAQVAKVNGEIITIEEYQKAYNNMMENYRRQFGSKIDDKMLEQLQLGRQTVDQLINQKLLLQEAKKLGFNVSDQELAEQIRSNPNFQNNGIFNKRLYMMLLSQNRLSVEEFESGMKQQMVIKKLQSFIVSFPKVSEDEAWNWFAFENKAVDLEYVLFKPEIYKNITLSDEEVKSYYSHNKEKYATEPKRKAQYLVFNPKNFVSKVNVTDEDVKEYYESHPEKYHQEKTVEARHILFKVDQNADEDTKQKVKKKAEEVLKLAREGKDFAALAKRYSEDSTKDTGGALGAFTHDSMVKPFADAAFALGVGGISDLVRTQFGWHIIKVEKINPEKTQSLDSVKAQIRAELISERSKNAAFERAEEVYEMLYNGEDISEVAAAQNLTVQKTDFFTKNGPKVQKNISDPIQFATIAFEMELMDISEVKELDGKFYIIQPFEKIESKIPTLEEVKDRLKADLTSQKQNENAKKDANSVIDALKKDDNFSEAVKPFNLEIKTTGFFKRNESIPQIGYERAIASAAFELNGKNKFSKTALQGKNGFYVIQLKGRREAALDEFEKQKEEVQKRLLQQKKYGAFNNYVMELRKRSEITVQDKFIK